MSGPQGRTRNLNESLASLLIGNESHGKFPFFKFRCARSIAISAGPRSRDQKESAREGNLAVPKQFGGGPAVVRTLERRRSDISRTPLQRSVQLVKRLISPPSQQPCNRPRSLWEDCYKVAPQSSSRRLRSILFRKQLSDVPRCAEWDGNVLLLHY